MVMPFFSNSFAKAVASLLVVKSFVYVISSSPRLFSSFFFDKRNLCVLISTPYIHYLLNAITSDIAAVKVAGIHHPKTANTAVTINDISIDFFIFTGYTKGVARGFRPSTLGLTASVCA